MMDIRKQKRLASQKASRFCLRMSNYLTHYFTTLLRDERYTCTLIKMPIHYAIGVIPPTHVTGDDTAIT